jgi:hypothetical protein
LAIAGETMAKFSQQSFDCGLGSSCSQALFAKRPSWMFGSGTMCSSMAEGCCGRAAGAGMFADAAVPARGGSAEPAMRPSLSHCLHVCSLPPFENQ